PRAAQTRPTLARSNVSAASGDCAPRVMTFSRTMRQKDSSCASLGEYIVRRASIAENFFLLTAARTVARSSSSSHSVQRRRRERRGAREFTLSPSLGDLPIAIPHSCHLLLSRVPQASGNGALIVPRPTSCAPASRLCARNH